MSIFLGTINLVSNWVAVLERGYIQIIGMLMSQVIYPLVRRSFSIGIFIS